jgi:hypothetical protein
MCVGKHFQTVFTSLSLANRARIHVRRQVAKLLYMAKRVKPEMLGAVSFLATRALEPDVDDLTKLMRARSVE